MGKIKVGYIHDGFDMFSIEDLKKIEEAKRNCEKLVVGVYSNQYFEKKYGRMPIIPCTDRVKIVNAMKEVCCAIEIDNEQPLTPEKLKEISSKVNSSIEEPEKSPKKYKIAFVQGVFDMFHAGHYNLLARAKELCDILVVGVNSDQLVKEYKNKTPIVPFEDRRRIVEAVKGVNYTIEMTDRNKIKAARQIGFEALIMGSDWQGTELYKIMEEELKQIGIDIVYIPYTKGISSTKLRKRINKDADGKSINDN